MLASKISVPEKMAEGDTAVENDAWLALVKNGDKPESAEGPAEVVIKAL